MAGIPETEAPQVWRAMREARVRSLYFGELAARYTRRQQWEQGLSLAFGSAAFVTLVREPWPLVAAGCAAVVAVANVWATATNLNQTQATLVMLRTAWEGLRLEYGDVWSNWYRDGAEAKFDALQRRSNDLGMLANAGGPVGPQDGEALGGLRGFRMEQGGCGVPGAGGVIQGSWPPIRPPRVPPPRLPPPPPKPKK